MELSEGSRLLVCTFLPTVSVLKFPRRTVSGAFCHLRSGGEVVNESGAMGKRRGGAGPAAFLVPISKASRTGV